MPLIISKKLRTILSTLFMRRQSEYGTFAPNTEIHKKDSTHGGRYRGRVVRKQEKNTGMD